MAQLRCSKRLQLLHNLLPMDLIRCRWADKPVDDFHLLRKITITNRLEAGVRPHEERRMAGYRSVETTTKRAARVDRSAIDRVREASVRYTGGQAQARGTQRGHTKGLLALGVAKGRVFGIKNAVCHRSSIGRAAVL